MVERDRAPHAEGIAERKRALMVCLEQGQRLRAGQGLDPQRARQAQERTVETVARHQRGAARGRLGGEIDHIWTLARQIQHGQPMLVTHEGSSLRSASACTSGSVQRCWWMSIFIILENIYQFYEL